ncbi:hypothetical protein [Solibacillus sp. CAU 1738]|uniref:hypothetical protein n=1 Tax=Solibacillus sp. CAU 1738 TaxID=3140363 RepID=UPI0032600D0B
MLVQNKGNHSYTANELTLNPGTNDVDGAEFEKFLAHPLMAHLDKQGEFEYEKEEKPLNAKDLIAMINDAFDIDMLEKLKEGEERKSVLEAIDKRIEELANPAK